MIVKMVLATIWVLTCIGVAAYVLFLATRFVRAVEKIVDKIK